MLALNTRASPAKLEARSRLVGSPWNCLVTPEAFQVALQAEVARHHRYLSGLGLLRIGPKVGEVGTDALREAFETETRRTDTACLLPDGSCALLALHVRVRQLEVIARRLREAAQALHEQYEDEPVEYVAGLAIAQDRRVEPEEIWLAMCRAYEDARLGRRLVRVAK